MIGAGHKVNEGNVPIAGSSPSRSNDFQHVDALRPNSPADLLPFSSLARIREAYTNRASSASYSPRPCASPLPGEDITEENRMKYALDIWYARYNGMWMPSIFPPTYIDLPRTILNEVCSKAVDKATMTFSHFADLLENSDKIQESYLRHHDFSTLTPDPNPSPSRASVQPDIEYRRPAFWQLAQDVIDLTLDDDLVDEEEYHTDSDVSILCSGSHAILNN